MKINASGLLVRIFGIGAVAAISFAAASGNAEPRQMVFAESDFHWGGLGLLSPGPPQPEEKRTIFTEENFHWQAKLAPGQTLEIVGRNGEIEAVTVDDIKRVAKRLMEPKNLIVTVVGEPEGIKEAGL